MIETRTRVDLVVGVLRTTRLTALVVTAVISVAFLAVPLVFGLRNSFRPFDGGVVFHLSLIVSLAGAGLLMDDAAHETLAATPLGGAPVTVIRMLAGLVVLTPVWALQLWLVPQLIDTEASIPLRGLAMEGPILVVWIWAVGLLLRSRFDGHASSVAVPVALIGCAILFFLPPDLSLFVNPSSDDFAASRVRFAVFGALGLVVLGLALRRRQPRMPFRRGSGGGGPGGPAG